MEKLRSCDAVDDRPVQTGTDSVAFFLRWLGDQSDPFYLHYCTFEARGLSDAGIGGYVISIEPELVQWRIQIICFISNGIDEYIDHISAFRQLLI